MMSEIEMETDAGAASVPGTFKGVVMAQLNKVNNFFNVEFRGGYFTTATTKDGTDKEVYVQDSREVFCNSVLAIALLAEPEFKHSKEMTKAFEKYYEQMKEIENKFMEQSSVDEEIILGEGFYDNERDKILLETYKMRKLNIHIKLYGAMAKLFKGRNYFGISGGTF